jgi:hypothetical protein
MVTKRLDTATDARALDAISAWLFEPGTLDGNHRSGQNDCDV